MPSAKNARRSTLSSSRISIFLAIHFLFREACAVLRLCVIANCNLLNVNREREKKFHFRKCVEVAGSRVGEPYATTQQPRLFRLKSPK